jgi:hypothetical protein
MRPRFGAHSLFGAPKPPHGYQYQYSNFYTPPFFPAAEKNWVAVFFHPTMPLATRHLLSPSPSSHNLLTPFYNFLTTTMTIVLQSNDTSLSFDSLLPSFIGGDAHHQLISDGGADENNLFFATDADAVTVTVSGAGDGRKQVDKMGFPLSSAVTSLSFGSVLLSNSNSTSPTTSSESESKAKLINKSFDFDSFPFVGDVESRQPISKSAEATFLPTENANKEVEAILEDLRVSLFLTQSNHTAVTGLPPPFSNVAYHDPISMGTDDNLMPTEAFFKDLQISPKQQEYKQPAKTSSESLVSPNGVDAFGSEKSAPDRFRYSYGNNGSVDFFSVTPIIDKGEKVDETSQLDFTKMFSEDFFLKEETPSKDKSYDTHTLPHVHINFLDFKSEQLMFADPFESFFGVLADKVEQVYDLVVATESV